MLIEYITLRQPNKRVFGRVRQYVFIPRPEYGGRSVCEVDEEDLNYFLPHRATFQPFTLEATLGPQEQDERGSATRLSGSAELADFHPVTAERPPKSELAERAKLASLRMNELRSQAKAMGLKIAPGTNKTDLITILLNQE